MPKNSSDQALMRKLNLSLVLRLIHNEAPISRAKIAQKTGLNKSTVSNLVGDLIQRRLIHEIGMRPGVHAGRPARLLEINALAGSIIGVEFGVDYVSVGLTNFTGEVLWDKSEGTDAKAAPENILAQTLLIIQEAIKVAKNKGLKILGIGVAVPGTVNVDEGFLIFAPNLQWRNIPLKAFFKKHTGLPVYVENDANAATIAEKLFGVVKESENFIFIFAGVGIGSGLFLNGELYRGSIGYAGEIGHSPIIVKPFEAPCHCGNRGCWETYANKFALIRRVQSRLDARRESIIPTLMRESKQPLSLKLIKDAADQGDKEAIGALQDTGNAMGLGIATLISILNPKQVVLGGPISVVGNYLIPAINAVIEKRVLPEFSPSVHVILSNFKEEASLIGPISVIVNNVFSNPLRVKGGDA